MTLDFSRMEVDLQEHERCRRTLTVRVPADVVHGERRAAAKRLARRLKLPGFRKGRVPTSVLERQYGPALQQEMLDRVVAEAYRTALSQRGLRPIGEGEVEAVDYRPEAGLAFRISFDVEPRVELTRLDGFQVARPRLRVEARDVDGVLESLREENAVWLPPEDEDRPRDGDLVTVRIVRLAEGGGDEPQPSGRSGAAPAAGARPVEDVGLPWARRLRLRSDTAHRGRYQFLLGAGDAVPALEEAVRSLAAGETRDFAVRLPGDPGEGAHGAGEQRLRITLEDWRTRELPELDDVFARSLGEFEDLDALRRQVLIDLEEEADEEAERVLRARLLDAVLEANPFEVPLSMVERYVDAMLGDTDEAEPDRVERARVELRAEAERAVKRRIVVDRVAETRGLVATPEEVDARVAEIAEGGRVAADQVRDRLLRSRRLDALVRDITETKVFYFLKGCSEILEGGEPDAGSTSSPDGQRG